MADGARTNRKSDTAASSSVPENFSSTETLTQSGDANSPSVSSQTKSAPRVRTEESQAASLHGHGSKPVPKASVAGEGEETSEGAAPEPADQSLHNDGKAAVNSSITQGEPVSCLTEEKQEKSSGEDGEEDVKTGEDKSTEETALRLEKKKNSVLIGNSNYLICNSLN